MDFVHSSIQLLRKINKFLCHLYELKISFHILWFLFSLCFCYYVKHRGFFVFFFFLSWCRQIYQSLALCFVSFLRNFSTLKCYKDILYFLPKAAFNIYIFNPSGLYFCIWCENGIQFYHMVNQLFQYHLLNSPAFSH